MDVASVEYVQHLECVVYTHTHTHTHTHWGTANAERAHILFVSADLLILDSGGFIHCLNRLS